MSWRALLVLACLVLPVVPRARQSAAAPSVNAAPVELIPLFVADGEHRGEVDLSVDIDSNGGLADATFLLGDETLVPLAKEDLEVFRYTPYAGAKGARQQVEFLRGTLVKTVGPIYPPIARAAHVQGAVMMAAAVRVDGSVGEIKILYGPPMLQGSAVQALQQWKFRSLKGLAHPRRRGPS